IVTARKGLHPDNELAACGARIGHRDRGLDPELVSGPRLPLGEAFDFRGVEGIKLVTITGLLRQDPRHFLARIGKGGLQHLVPGDLPADVTIKAAKPCSQLANPAHCLAVAAAMDEDRKSTRLNS